MTAQGKLGAALGKLITIRNSPKRARQKTCYFCFALSELGFLKSDLSQGLRYAPTLAVMFRPFRPRACDPGCHVTAFQAAR